MVDAGCRVRVYGGLLARPKRSGARPGWRFAGGVFTNLTHDHLDYHGSFAAYRDAKKSFFDQLPEIAFALTNADDQNPGAEVGSLLRRFDGLPSYQ